MSLDIQIEGILFYKAAPVSFVELERLLHADRETLRGAVTSLRERLAHGATRLVETTTELQLVTAPALSDLLETLRKDELRRDIGKAGAETLAIILYREPITRAEIEHIRGVNSGFILRNLQTRGLIKRQPKQNTFTYFVTPELLAHLGITNKTELPQYSDFMNRIDAFQEPTPAP